MSGDSSQDPTRREVTPQPGLPDSGSADGKINPDLVISQRKKGRRPGDTYIRTLQPYRRLFRGWGGRIVATPEAHVPGRGMARGLHLLKTALLGRPLLSREEMTQRLDKVRALAVFGSDAISSCAYATEAALVVLVVAGNSALNVSFFIALAVALLLTSSPSATAR